MGTQPSNEETLLENLSFEKFREEVLNDYRIVCESREASILARKEVLTGKAKFGIFGDGKEVAQVAMAKFFKPGDFRAGYYRDQTFMFASGLSTIEQFFSQLYADPEIANDPFSAGRQMNSHFASRFVDENGDWMPLSELKNITSDIAPTAGQMPRALGIALGSKLFRESPGYGQFRELSDNGNEVCFCTIGDASTSEGHFWETMNAAGVWQIPLAVFVWDDGYGISVPKKYQTTKASISRAMAGLQKEENTNGINIYNLKGWDYAGMCEALEGAIKNIRRTHVPALFHIEDITQPLGHSTSGSQERYKSHDRLSWERHWDCKKQMRDWIIGNALATETEMVEIENAAKALVKQSRKSAWEKYINPIRSEVNEVVGLLQQDLENQADKSVYDSLINELVANKEPLRRDVLKTLSLAIEVINPQPSAKLIAYYNRLANDNHLRYNTRLYNEGPKSALKVEIKAPVYEA
ncbi:MAG: thiamine pyrophosphate-dependent dehydrogenase E1 component subunit alpha, partial [Bacteroidota bacterium]|nr:thiamine pyrophosphate-dependent dehydrogenase E1 component subunit alpha [Bacteroidota bacterium]